MAQGSVKLLDVLRAKIAEGEETKLLKGVERQVKEAKITASREVYELELVVDKAEERLQAVNENPSASLSAIISAQRDLDLAKANLEAANAINKARF